MAPRRAHLQKNVGWRDVSLIEGAGSLEEQSGHEVFLWRTIFLYVIGAAAFAVVFVSAVNLQIVQGRDFSARSKNNRLVEHVIIPDRGIIYDRGGRKLVENVASFNVIIDPHEVESQEVLRRIVDVLSVVLELKKEDLLKVYGEALKLDALTDRVVLASDIDRDKVLKVRSRSDDLPGVWVEYGSKRKYVGGREFSQVIGYTGEVNAQDLDGDAALRGGDIVGKDGLESYYDERFRGKKGVEVVEIDVLRNVLARYVNSGVAPVPGDSLYLTLDYESQKKFYAILANGMKHFKATGAAGVLMDVKTGEVWASVSVPSYDNNLFIGGISDKNYKALLKDKNLPLFNRTISAQQPPGSMFKTIVAAAALQERAISPGTVFDSVGTIYTETGAFLCQEYQNHKYGRLNLNGGIAKSSNLYFYYTLKALGINKLLPYADFFGVGRTTGIDLPGEAKGRIHSPESKRIIAKNSPWIESTWYPGDICNAAIGQGVTLVTPTQVADWTAAIANGGKIIKPRLAGKWEPGVALGEEPEDPQTVKTVVARTGKVSASNLAIVRQGMRNSASGPQSIIIPFRDAKVPVAGKTGTAEFGVKDAKGYYTKTHAWVSGFFPYDNPRFSFVVFLEGGGASNNAAQLARDFINWFADARMK